MKILVDADACPVKNIIVKIAREYRVQVLMFVDINHLLNDSYSKVIVVDQGRDAVDIALINRVEKNDIVVTQDYGLATLALSKQAYAINQNGFIYTWDNIDRLLFERYLSQKVRRSGGKAPGPKKRNQSDNEEFKKVLRSLCSKTTNIFDLDNRLS